MITTEACFVTSFVPLHLHPRWSASGLCRRWHSALQGDRQDCYECAQTAGGDTLGETLPFPIDSPASPYCLQPVFISVSAPFAVFPYPSLIQHVPGEQCAGDTNPRAISVGNGAACRFLVTDHQVNVRCWLLNS